MNKFQKMSPQVQGLIFLVLGIVMILYALGLVQKGISFLVILFAGCLIGMGYIKLGIHHKVMQLLHRRR